MEGSLELQGVVKRLRGPAHPVLDGLDLVVPAGAIAGVTGANGAGKTTLLRVISGLLRTDAGRVRLAGLDPERSPREYRRRVGFLSADGGLYARLSVRSHLAWWAAMTYVPPARRQREVDDALETFRLAELASRRVERLSAGQRQRVRLAMTLLPGAPLLLLDEPEARLDEDALALLTGRLAEHARTGGMVVWAAPEGRAAELPSDELHVVRQGRLERLA